MQSRRYLIWLALFALFASVIALGACDDTNDVELSVGQEQLALGTIAPPYGEDEVTVAYDVKVNGDETDFYYPSTGRHPVALLLQGAKTDKSFYSEFARELARYGFVVAVPNHTSVPWIVGYSPVQSQINDMVDFMNDAGDRGSLGFGARIDPSRMGVLGHSYGGQAVAQAVSNDCGVPTCFGLWYRLPSEVKAAVLYGVNLKNPLFGTYPRMKNEVPALFLQGSLDGKADSAGAYKTWEKFKNSPKLYVELCGANHYGICDENNPSGADADPEAPTLDQDVGIETGARWAGAFLRAHVLGDRAAKDYAYLDGDEADEVVTVSACER